MTQYEADVVEQLARLSLDVKFAEMAAYLRSRGFTPAAADKAIRTYIDTQAFVAREIALST